MPTIFATPMNPETPSGATDLPNVFLFLAGNRGSDNFYITLMSKGLFIAGTGTGVGKSHVSAFFLQKLKDTTPEAKILYYKPIQCGTPTDVSFIKKQTKHKLTACTYNLKTPSSPHFAFEQEDVKFEKIVIKSFLTAAKKQYDFIIMEGAGGVRVPITYNFDMADLAKLSGFPVLLVAEPGLGTINHTLLSIDYLKSKDIEVKGFLFSGLKDSDSEDKMVLDNANTIEKLSKVMYQGAVPFIRLSPKKSI